MRQAKGLLFPSVHIVSMASAERRKGNGALMMNLCTSLLFSDRATLSTMPSPSVVTPPSLPLRASWIAGDAVLINRGMVFAQCLNVEFWEYRLHPVRASTPHSPRAPSTIFVTSATSPLSPSPCALCRRTREPKRSSCR